MNNQATDIWKRLRNARRSPHCSCRRSASSTLRWTSWFCPSYASPAGQTSCSDDSRTSESTSWPSLCDLCPVVGLRKEECQESCSQCFRNGLLRSSAPTHLGGLRILSRLGPVDPAVHLCEFSLSVLRGTLGEWYTWWCSSSPVFMHTAFLNTNRRRCIVRNDCVWSCLMKLQSSLLSELSNCTNTLYFDEVCKSTERFWLCPNRIVVTAGRLEKYDNLPLWFDSTSWSSP